MEQLSNLKSTENTERNLTWHNMDITREVRAEKMDQQPKTVWLTGLSGAGKSTLLHILACIDNYQEGEYTIDGTLVKNLFSSLGHLLLE